MRSSHRVAATLGLILLAGAVATTDFGTRSRGSEGVSPDLEAGARTGPAGSRGRPLAVPRVAAPPDSQAAGPRPSPETPLDAPDARTSSRRSHPEDEADDGPSRRIAAAAPFLERTTVVSGATSARLRGEDPSAPGPLVLWRETEQGFAPLARGMSTPAGGFDFGQVAVPARGLDVVVTRAGEAPAAARPGSRLHIEPSEIPPPLARVERARDDVGWSVELIPVRLDGWLVIENGAGQALAEVELAALDPMLRRRIRVDVAPNDGPWVRVAHRLDDGRRSAWLGLVLAGGDTRVD